MRGMLYRQLPLRSVYSSSCDSAKGWQVENGVVSGKISVPLFDKVLDYDRVWVVLELASLLQDHRCSLHSQVVHSLSARHVFLTAHTCHPAASPSILRTICRTNWAAMLGMRLGFQQRHRYNARDPFRGAERFRARILDACRASLSQDLRAVHGWKRSHKQSLFRCFRLMIAELSERHPLTSFKPQGALLPFASTAARCEPQRLQGVLQS